MLKEDASLFETVMPQLQQILQNCIYTKTMSSKKGQYVQKSIASKGVKVPLPPEKMCRVQSDDINNANRKSRQSNKRRKRNKKNMDDDSKMRAKRSKKNDDKNCNEKEEVVVCVKHSPDENNDEEDDDVDCEYDSAEDEMEFSELRRRLLEKEKS